MRQRECIQIYKFAISKTISIIAQTMATYTWDEIEEMAKLQGVPVFEVVDKLVEENLNQLN